MLSGHAMLIMVLKYGAILLWYSFVSDHEYTRLLAATRTQRIFYPLELKFILKAVDDG